MVSKKRAVSGHRKVVRRVASKIIRRKVKVRIYKRTMIVNKKPVKIDIFMPEPWSRVEKYKKIKAKNEYITTY